jgi:hypothetical protein
MEKVISNFSVKLCKGNIQNNKTPITKDTFFIRQMIISNQFAMNLNILLIEILFFLLQYKMTRNTGTHRRPKTWKLRSSLRQQCTSLLSVKKSALFPIHRNLGKFKISMLLPLEI